MRNFKKVVAGLLAVLMLALSVNVSFAAEEYTEDEAVVVAKVNAAGIMTGTDKGFEPSKSLTRAEAAAIIVRMKGISESAVKASAGTTLFTDVAASHWASGYINQASNLGIVKGVSATQYAPDREVTVAEFTTMAIRALGAGQLVDSQGTWPTNYVNFANENGILDDVNAIYTATSTRLQAATIVANTLEAVMWEKSGVKSNGEISWTKNENDKTILENVLNIVKYENVTITANKIKATLVAKTIEETPKTVLNGVDVAETVDLASTKAGVAYDIWYDKDTKEVVGIWASENAEQKLVEFTEIVKDEANGKLKVKVNGEDTEYEYAAKTVVYYNGVEKTTANVGDSFASATLKSKTNYTTAANVFGSIMTVSDEITAVYLEEYTNVGLVDEVTSSKVKFDALDGYGIAHASTLTINDKDYMYNMDMDTLKEGDVVFYYQEGTTKVFHVLVSTNTVEGKVTAHGEDYIKIDGAKYKLVGDLDIDNGKEVVAYLNEAGKIVAYEELDDSSNEYAIVKTIEAVNGRKGVDFEIKLAFFDGTVTETYTLDLEETADEEVITDCDKENEVLSYVAYGDITHADTATDLTVDALNTAITDGTASLLGKVVNYEITDGKLVLTAIDTDDVKVETGKLEISRKSKVGNYYFDDNTKFVVVKADSDKKYNVKVEAVEFDSLKTTDSLAYTVAGINDNYVDYVLLSDDVKRVTEDGLFGIFLNQETLDKDDDFKFAYTVLFADEAKTLYSDVDYTKVGQSSPYANYMGTVAEFTLDGDEITEIDRTVASSGKEGFGSIVKSTNPMYCVDKNADGLFVYAEVANNTTTEKQIYNGRQFATLAEKVMYVVKDSTKYKEGNANDIVELVINKNTDDAYTIDEEQEIAQLITRVSDKGVAEVIAVIYVKK